MNFMSATPCPVCRGKRLRPESLAVKIGGLSIADFTALPLNRALSAAINLNFTAREALVADRIRREIVERLEFLCAVGLDLSLARSQRRHALRRRGPAHPPRHADRLAPARRALRARRALHRPSSARQQPPHRGPRSGSAISATPSSSSSTTKTPSATPTTFSISAPARAASAATSSPKARPQQIMACPESLTGRYLSGAATMLQRAQPRPLTGKWITVTGAREHNLQDLTIRIPLGVMTVVTGVSGSGKSTLINDILYRSLAKTIYGSREEPGAHDALTGAEQIDKVIRIDQSPIGRTPRSNPATYTQVFSPIRDLFAMLPEARERGYKPGRFSFNVTGGRCEACQGDGQRRIEMNFMPDVYVQCEVCNGRRYNQETLAVKFKGHSIADVLDLTIEDALTVLADVPQVRQKLQTLVDVGLGYVHLGQSATTLSGGEAQRMKLARELSQAPDRPHPLSARRAHHRPALRRRAQAARSAAPPRRPRQLRHHHRAQSRRHPQRRLDPRPRPRRRRRRRPHRRRRAARQRSPPLPAPTPASSSPATTPPTMATWSPSTTPLQCWRSKIALRLALLRVKVALIGPRGTEEAGAFRPLKTRRKPPRALAPEKTAKHQRIKNLSS